MDPSKAGFILREDYTLKPHDFTTIEQNILDIRKVEISTETLENKTKQKKKKENNPLIWESFNRA